MTRSKIATLTHLAHSPNPDETSRFFRLGLKHTSDLHRLLHLAIPGSPQYVDIQDAIRKLDELTLQTRERLRGKGEKESEI